MKKTEKTSPGGFRSRVEDANSIVRGVYDGEDDASGKLDQLFLDEEGVRAFFVAWLTDSNFDIKNEKILRAIETNHLKCRNTIVKNLAMSSAMVIHHGKNNDNELQAGSLSVLNRTLQLIDELPDGILNEILDQLKAAVQARIEDKEPSDSNPFGEFLKRWHYDIDQLKNIENSIKKASC